MHPPHNKHGWGRPAMRENRVLHRLQQEYQGIGKKFPCRQDSSDQPTCMTVYSRGSPQHRVTSFSEFILTAHLWIREVTYSPAGSKGQESSKKLVVDQSAEPSCKLAKLSEHPRASLIRAEREKSVHSQRYACTSTHPLGPRHNFTHNLQFKSTCPSAYKNCGHAWKGLTSGVLSVTLNFQSMNQGHSRKRKFWEET